MRQKMRRSNRSFSNDSPERKGSFLDLFRKKKNVEIKGIEGKGKTYNPYKVHKKSQPDLTGKVHLTSENGKQSVRVE